jgi:hypothetical protein
MVHSAQVSFAIKSPTTSSMGLVLSCDCDHSPRFLKNVIPKRLVQQCYCSSKRLLDRICQNMFNTLEIHREGHRVLELQLFKKAIGVSLNLCNRFTV